MRNVVPLHPPALPPNRLAVAAVPARIAQWARTTANNPYSRRVALLKRILPAIALALLLMVAVWPRLAPLIERMRFMIPAIDLRAARELRMLNPRYSGTDRENRPFVVTAAAGEQAPDRDDLMSLESPRGDLKSHNGEDIVVTAATGIYQSKTQILDLYGDVTLTRQNGTRFLTDAARVNVADNSAQGDDPITGHSPSGDVKAQGFRVLDKGDTIIFTGRSDLVMIAARPVAPKSQPPAVPATVAQQAATIEATASPELAAAARPLAKTPAPRAHPRVVAPAHPVAARPVAHPAAKLPANKAGTT
jgi:lipopolysaccharide export system protein LptC